MKRICALPISAVLLASLAFSGGCAGGASGEREKLIDKSVEAAAEMAKAFAGNEEVDKKMAEMRAELDKKKPEAIKKCAEALAKDKELEKTVDCLIAAKDLQAMGACEGADKLSGVLQ